MRNPFEEQATKWTPQLRERYFDMLADCTDLSCVDYQETPNAQLMAYRRIVKQSDMLVAVYDTELASLVAQRTRLWPMPAALGETNPADPP